MTYLRMTIGEWDVDLDAPSGQHLVDLIRSEGLGVLRRQPGFVHYRLMRAGPSKSIAFVEWESEERALAGAAKYRQWLEDVGIKAHLSMDTTGGPLLISSDPESG